MSHEQCNRNRVRWPRNKSGVTMKMVTPWILRVAQDDRLNTAPGTEAGVTVQKATPRILRVAQDDGTHAARGTCKNEKAPSTVYRQGGVNPAATYSPGSEDQVPSAIWGLTSVFGMGTGMTPTR